MKPTMLHHAYLLHQWAYRDTSLLIELFTREQGRLTAVAKGVRTAKSKMRGVLQLLTPLVVSCSGKTELLTLCNAEPAGKMLFLTGESLFSAMYLNELIVKILPRFDPYPEVYNAYEICLNSLSDTQKIEQSLRQFEKCLLKELGYELILNKEALTGREIDSTAYYFYNQGQGIILHKDETFIDKNIIFKGDSILALHDNSFDNLEKLRDAKRLMRIALAPLLIGKSLKSRELFK